jgi:hypothetical protein
MNTTGTTIATATTTLLAKAEALVASGGLTATDRPGVYRATSSDGTGSYVCTAQGVCGCEAARRGNACKHVLAAQIAVADAQRERAAARGIVVLRGEPAGELLAPDFEVDLYGNGNDSISEGEMA